ncbi:AAA family ATPase [Brevibacterium sp. SMBL_HHYL_HB1]|uniref:ATP-binding protein n=1 Tax=Brevibacterium sp. SMBL_HHYL_HB1 TaxID=2777556 RepID=UPI001BAD0F61|nr:AAA family ATPase [Brevibacterium sp. SMBL_HHYL_HB1]QUL80976.1 AAA family ATPase [Brevibacterium sp. SMBL_HHYL_HB1]
MRLHSITLVDYRGITDATVDFGSGVTIVEGPNEIGKSSIHQAITQLRTDKAGSRKASVKDTQPVGSDVGPQVELHLSTGEYEVRYRKRWLRQPFTELNILKPVPEQISGDEAHERFLSILDDTIDVDLLDALDVAQGRSLAQAPLAEIKALHGALNESGEEPADHDAFLDRVETEYLKYFTAKGKPTGELRKLAEELPAAEERFGELDERSRELDAFVDRHARATERLESVRAQLSSAVTELDEVEEAAKAVSGLRTELDRAVELAESAGREQQRAEEARDRRLALVSEATAAEETVQAAEEALDKLVASQRERDADFSAAKKALEAKQTELDRARADAKSASAALAQARARREVSELRKRLTNIREQERRAVEAQATIESITVSAEDVEGLSDLVTEVRIAENARTAAAAQIVARRLGDTEVSVDGTALPDDTAEEFAVVKDMRVHIDSVVDITVRPGQSPAELDRAVESAQADLDAELERLGVESLDQARHRAEERASAEAVLAEANSTLRVLIGSDDRAELDTALSRAEHLAGESAESSEPGTEPAGIDELETAVESTAAAVDAAQEAVDTAREALERSRTNRDEARVAAVRAQTTHEQATTTAQNLNARLAADRESNSDESLDERVTEAKAQAQEREEAVASARARYQASDPETLEMRLQNARGLLESKQKQQESDRQEVDRLAALIDDRAGEGIYDKLKDAEETLESLRSRLTRLRRQADAIGLLRETVLAHKEEAQRKYVAPFKEQIERLGRVIFGQDLSVEISEDLEIVSRTLNGRTVAFDSLSGGTKEQLALIGRLAVATLVDESSGAPVILDDAFGFADEKRLAALNVILGNVGRNAQVILLTCQPGRFGAIGGAETVSLA